MSIQTGWQPPLSNKPTSSVVTRVTSKEILERNERQAKLQATAEEAFRALEQFREEDDIPPNGFVMNLNATDESETLVAVGFRQIGASIYNQWLFSEIEALGATEIVYDPSEASGSFKVPVRNEELARQAVIGWGSLAEVE